MRSWRTAQGREHERVEEERERKEERVVGGRGCGLARGRKVNPEGQGRRHVSARGGVNARWGRARGSRGLRRSSAV
jgi:hypothetical protein